MFAIISLYLPLIFSNGVRRHVVEYDKLRFLPEIISNAVCEECLQISIYIYHLFSAIGERGHIVKYDKPRFQPEMICNAVCCMWRMFANIYLYLPITPSNGFK